MICSHLVNMSLLLGALLSWGILWPLICDLKGDWYYADMLESSMRCLQGYKVPTKEQVDALSKELLACSTVPAHIYNAIDALPVTAHPMSQITTGVMALQVESGFQKAYDSGLPKSKFWEPTYKSA